MAARHLAHQALVVADAVHVGGVEEVAAELDRPFQGRERLLVVAPGVELRHAHAAEADLRYFEPLAAKLAPLEHERVSVVSTWDGRLPIQSEASVSSVRIYSP